MIDQKGIHNLAELARMKLSEKEALQFEKELGGILDYVGELQKVDTSGILHDAGLPPLRNVWRDDTPALIQADREAILEEAPLREKDYFAVKKVIEYES